MTSTHLVHRVVAVVVAAVVVRIAVVVQPVQLVASVTIVVVLFVPAPALPGKEFNKTDDYESLY